MGISTATLQELREMFASSSQAEAEAAAAIAKVLQIRETGTLPSSETGRPLFTRDGRPNRLSAEGLQKIREARARRAEREKNGGMALVERKRNDKGQFVAAKKPPQSVKKKAA